MTTKTKRTALVLISLSLVLFGASQVPLWLSDADLWAKSLTTIGWWLLVSAFFIAGVSVQRASKGEVK